MVFELLSNVHSRNSVEEVSKTTKLYSPTTIDLDVHNPFGTDLVFTITILHDKKGLAAGGKKKSQQGKKTDKREGEDPQKKKSVGAGVPDPFHCKMETVRIKKNGSNIVPINFLPFELGVHKCFVVFSDENVGEIQYTLIGRAELPDPLDTVREKCNADEVVPIEVPLPYRNLALDKARTLVLDRTQGAKKDAAQKGKPQTGESLFFEIEISNPYYSGPSSVTIQDMYKGAFPSNTKDQNSL